MNKNTKNMTTKMKKNVVYKRSTNIRKKMEKLHFPFN